MRLLPRAPTLIHCPGRFWRLTPSPRVGLGAIQALTLTRANTRVKSRADSFHARERPVTRVISPRAVRGTLAAGQFARRIGESQTRKRVSHYSSNWQVCCFVLLLPTPEEYRVPRVNPGVTASKLFPPLLPSRGDQPCHSFPFPLSHVLLPGRPLPPNVPGVHSGRAAVGVPSLVSQGGWQGGDTGEEERWAAQQRKEGFVHAYMHSFMHKQHTEAILSKTGVRTGLACALRRVMRLCADS